MKKWIILSASLVLALVLIVFTFKDNILNNFKEEPIEGSHENSGNISKEIKKEGVSKAGIRWKQSKAYDTYSIHVDNTGDEIMTVTVSSFLGGTWNFKVPTNDSSTWTVKKCCIQ